MNAPSRQVRLAGVLYVAASVGFIIVFSWLAARFGYPDVLDLPATQVLPELIALGPLGRLMWAAYAVLPLLLVPAAMGARSALSLGDPRADKVARMGVVLQVVSSIAMTIGLARWSTAQWSLGEAWSNADAAQQLVISARFDVLNTYLGNVIGEFVGELALYGSFAAFASTMWRNGARRMATFAAITAVSGWIGMFRNITAAVQPVSDVTNVLLPLFLIAFGMMLCLSRVMRPRSFAAAPSDITSASTQPAEG